MKIAFISDTHNSHKSCEMWLKSLNKWEEFCNADIVCHCGDFYKIDCEDDISFLEWFNELPNRYKIFIAGNHDSYFEKNSALVIEELLKKYPNIIYLNDSGVTIEGINFWGSPITPTYNNRAFNRTRSFGLDNIQNGIKKHWDLIPHNIDVLLVHGPPNGILDKTFFDYNAGCIDLLNKINKILPKIVAFGHIHEAYGMIKQNNIIFVNACLIDFFDIPSNLPHIIEI